MIWERKRYIQSNYNFLKITGIINKTFKPNKVQEGTWIKLYNTLALPVLLYGCKTSTVKSKDKSRLTAMEMRFMQKTAKYTWEGL
jgi:hypothetical protein